MAAMMADDEVSSADIAQVQKVAEAARAARTPASVESIDVAGSDSEASVKNGGAPGASDILKLAAAQGFPARGAVGSMFSRDKEGAQSNKYKSLETTEDKAAFRKKWAALKLEKQTLVKQRTDTLSNTHFAKGGYKSIRWLIKEEGLEAAKTYVASCETNGGTWTKEDPMWKQTRYWVAEETELEKLDKSISLTASSSNSSSTAPRHRAEPHETATAAAPKAAAGERAAAGEGIGGKRKNNRRLRASWQRMTRPIRSPRKKRL